jgi:hypothetical protein
MLAKLALATVALLAVSEAAEGQSRRTKSGYAACLTREDHSQFTRYIVNRDQEAAASLIAQSRCIMLRAGVEVFIEDTKILGGQIKIRPKGATIGLWTNIEAIT